MSIFWSTLKVSMMSYRGQIFKIILRILLKNIIYILYTYYLRRQRLVEINNIGKLFTCEKTVFTEWNDKKMHKSNYIRKKYTRYIEPGNLRHISNNYTTSFVCFIPWSTFRNWYFRPFKYEFLRQKRCFTIANNLFASI
jgi:hypothetical protein